MPHPIASRPPRSHARDAAYGSNAGEFELPSPPVYKPSSTFPALRLSESKDYVTVVAIVPGFAEADLDITLANDVLCIVGRHRSEVPGGFTMEQRSRRSTDFRSEIKLLNEVAWDDTAARLERGVLTIRLRKDVPSSRPPIPNRLT